MLCLIFAYNIRACRKTLVVGRSSIHVGNFSVEWTSTRGLGHDTPCFSYLSFIQSRLSISQPSHLPEVIADTYQLPDQLHLVQTPVHKSPEAEDLLDLPEHVLDQAGPAPHPLFPMFTR